MASPIRCHPVASVLRSWKQLHRGTQSRCFSSTAHQEQRITRAREQFFRWLNSRGQVYREPAPGTTNYLTAPNKGKISSNAAVGEEREVAGESVTPFILNPTFISQPILSEEMREDIWKRIMQDGQSVREVSATLGVDMRRVGAVVRLKEIEKEWLRMGKPLARPYANAVMSMLPKGKDQHDGHFEPINDISLHAATSPQIFYPTSESRHFTRSDAARIFDENLLPADNRIPHPQMIHMRKDIEAGYTPEEVKERQQAREEVEETRREARRQKKAQKEAEAVKTVDTQRWRFRFTDVNVDDAGKTGRGEKGVGWRYGAPLMDRKKGMVKIPTKVE